jgi:hypothetical protein
LLFKVWQSARIDKEEEMALGVPEFLEPRPFTNFVRDSDEPTLGEKRGDLANGAGRNGSAVDAEVNVRAYYKRAFKTPNRSRDKTLPSAIINDVLSSLSPANFIRPPLGLHDPGLPKCLDPRLCITCIQVSCDIGSVVDARGNQLSKIRYLCSWKVF